MPACTFARRSLVIVPYVSSRTTSERNSHRSPSTSRRSLARSPRSALATGSSPPCPLRYIVASHSTRPREPSTAASSRTRRSDCVSPSIRAATRPRSVSGRSAKRGWRTLRSSSSLSTSSTAASAQWRSESTIASGRRWAAAAVNASRARVASSRARAASTLPRTSNPSRCSSPSTARSSSPSRPDAPGSAGSTCPAPSSTAATARRTFSATPSWLSPGSTSQAPRTASASGHHTLASPYGTQRPWSTRAPWHPRAISATSSANRDLPTPASPTISSSAARRRATARSVAGGQPGPLGHPGRHRRVAALGGDLAHRSVSDDAPGRKMGGLPHQHLARLGGGLQPLRRVHDIAHRRVVTARPQRAHEDLAGVHAHAQAHVGIELRLPGGERLVQLQRGTHRPLGVVLVGDRGAEQGQDGIAHDLVHPSAEGDDVGDQPLEAPVDQGLHLLGVAVLRQPGEPDQVGEHHSDHTPLVAAHLQVGAACRAETRAVRHLGAAGGAGHAGESRDDPNGLPRGVAGHERILPGRGLCLLHGSSTSYPWWKPSSTVATRTASRCVRPRPTGSGKHGTSSTACGSGPSGGSGGSPIRAGRLGVGVGLVPVPPLVW